MKQLSIRQLAAKAGVSPTTVSLVLNNRDQDLRISPATRDKVLRMVKKYGYSTDQFHRTKAARKSKTMGLVVPDLTVHYFARFAQSFEECARAKGYQLFVTCSHDNEKTEREEVRNLVARSIGGLIIASVISRDELPHTLLRTRGIPAVFIDRKIEDNLISWVTSDNYQGTFRLIDMMCREKTASFAYIGGLPVLSTSRERLSGFTDALTKNGVRVRKNIISHGIFTEDSGYEQLEKIVKDTEKLPDIIFTSASVLLEGALRYLKDECGTLPSRPRLCTFDDHPMLDYLKVPVCAVRQDCGALARAAYEQLDAAMVGNRTVTNRVVMPEVVVR